MSIEITVKQKGFFKRKIPKIIVLGGSLECGVFDGLRLDTEKNEGNELVFYNPECIGRGFTAIFSSGEISLMLPLPTAPTELKDFFDAVKRIVDFKPCTLIVDGEEADPKDFFVRFDEYLNFNNAALNEFLSSIINEESDNLTLYCAMWPITVGKESAEKLISSPASFEKWLHEMQCEDLYYAKPSFYLKDGEICGRYALTEGVRSIFPERPYVPFGENDPRTGIPLECENFEIALCSTSKMKVIGEIPYSVLFENLGRFKLSPYDAECFIIEPLTLNEMESLI